jgi:prepilin signal peptidase PulO-like enzyme (type II secretory pathway)
VKIAVTLLAAPLGWLAGIGLNWLAVWLPTHRILESKSSASGTVAKVEPLSATKTCPARWRALALQGMSALLGILLWLRFGPTWALLPASLGVLLLLLIAAIDIDRRLVFDEVLLAGAMLALINAGLGGWSRLLASLAGAALGVGVFSLLIFVSRLVFRVGASSLMGSGDVKLVGLLGLMFGYPIFLRVLLVGVLVGGVVSAVLLATRQVSRRAFLPYAPFLATGGIVVLLVG